MKSKWFVSIIFIMACFMLTGCGALVYTETSFLEDGNGERKIYITIADEDESNIKGGFDHVLKILKNKAPNGISVKMKKQDSNTIFILSYEFNSIDDYKVKTKAMTQKESDIIWKKDRTGFRNKICYRETLSSTELIKWAIEEIKSQFRFEFFFDQSMVKADTSYVYFQKEEVWRGIKNPEFEAEFSPKLEKVEVFSKYSFDNKAEKKINLCFAYEDFKEINLEKGLSIIKDFSPEFEVNINCNGYSAVLIGEKQIKAFLEKVSDVKIDDEVWKQWKKEDNRIEGSYRNEVKKSTVLGEEYEICEIYNFNKLFEAMGCECEYIENYLSVPEKIMWNIEKVYQPFAQERTEAYPYIGKYPAFDTYYAKFKGENSVKMISADVIYRFEGIDTVTRNVVLLFDKKQRNITIKNIRSYFNKQHEWADYEEVQEGIKLTLIKTFQNKEGSTLKKTGRKKYEFYDDFHISNYFIPIGIPVSYQLIMPKGLKTESCMINDIELSQKDNLVYKMEQEDNQEFNLDIIYRYQDKFFNWFFGAIVLIIIGLGVTVIICIKKYTNNRKEEETY